ncbi:MAG: hypothetical protein KFF73_06990 [Cyclobacteriaceae bacterium]|nr:hypothetical protein [Cyclobacteriaceae bacterium]
MKILNYTIIIQFLILNALIFVLAIPDLWGQIEQPTRYEVELEYEDDFFNVLPVDEYGIVLSRKNTEVFEKGKIPWQFLMLDTTLQERWKNDIFIDYYYELRGFDHVKNKVYYLFRHEENRAVNDKIIEIDVLTGMHQQYDVTVTLNFELTEFEIIDNSAIFGGYVNMRPTVFQYFFKEGRTKVYPGLYFDKSRLLQVDVNETREMTTVISSIRTFEKENTIAIRKFTADGEMMESFNLTPKEKTSLIDARNVSVDMNTDIIAGTYSGKNMRYSRGIFLAYIDARGEEVIKYYNYAELENFFSYMKAKREKRVKERIERKKIKGKKLKFNYRLLVHDIIPFENNFILLGEAYYPKYNNYSAYGGFQSYYPSSRSNYSSYYFEGYQYTHAVVIGFDKEGNLLWDNSFEINDAMSYQLKQFVHVDPRENDIVLLYNYENVIRTKMIKGEEVIEGKSFNDISLKFQDDEVKTNNSEYGGLEKWYDDRFFAYGIQNIKNMKDVGVKLNRKVFFINKIIYN